MTAAVATADTSPAQARRADGGPQGPAAGGKEPPPNPARRSSRSKTSMSPTTRASTASRTSPSRSGPERSSASPASPATASPNFWRCWAATSAATGHVRIRGEEIDLTGAKIRRPVPPTPGHLPRARGPPARRPDHEFPGLGEHGLRLPPRPGLPEERALHGQCRDPGRHSGKRCGPLRRPPPRSLAHRGKLLGRQPAERSCWPARSSAIPTSCSSASPPAASTSAPFEFIHQQIVALRDAGKAILLVSGGTRRDHGPRPTASR